MVSPQLEVVTNPGTQVLGHLVEGVLSALNAAGPLAWPHTTGSRRERDLGLQLGDAPKRPPRFQAAHSFTCQTGGGLWALHTAHAMPTRRRLEIRPKT